MYYDDWNDEREERKAELFPVLLTPAEVMEILGVGKNTVYRLLNSGELQGFRVGRSWRISEADIRGLIDHIAVTGDR